MNQIDLTIEPREKKSKSGNRRTRREGGLPGVVYGGTGQPTPIVIDGVQFQKMQGTIHRSTVFNLKNGGATEQAILREVQRDPVRDTPLHVDFMRIQADKPIHVDVPIHGVGGVPIGVKLGGVLEAIIRRVEIKVLPLEVPEYLEIDISGLELGRSLHVSDLKVPEGVEVITGGHETLFIVAVPKTAETATATGPEVTPAETPEAGKAGAKDAKGGAPKAAAPAAKGGAAPKAGGKGK